MNITNGKRDTIKVDSWQECKIFLPTLGTFSIATAYSLKNFKLILFSGVLCVKMKYGHGRRDICGLRAAPLEANINDAESFMMQTWRRVHFLNLKWHQSHANHHSWKKQEKKVRKLRGGVIAKDVRWRTDQNNPAELHPLWQKQSNHFIDVVLTASFVAFLAPVQGYVLR